jgi:hypothetical protein
LSTSLPPKDVICECGHSFTSQQYSNWCAKCGRQVFYDPRDKRKSRINHIYFTSLIVLVVLFLTYFFIEMILTPVLTNLQ